MHLLQAIQMTNTSHVVVLMRLCGSCNSCLQDVKCPTLCMYVCVCVRVCVVSYMYKQIRTGVSDWLINACLV